MYSTSKVGIPYSTSFYRTRVRKYLLSSTVKRTRCTEFRTPVSFLLTRVRNLRSQEFCPDFYVLETCHFNVRANFQTLSHLILRTKPFLRTPVPFFTYSSDIFYAIQVLILLIIFHFSSSTLPPYELVHQRS